MSSEAMLQRAQELFDNCQYSEAGNLAIEVLKADPTSARPAYLMFARSYLHLLTPFNLEDNQDTFFSAIGSAIDTADSIEEAFEIDYEVMGYYGDISRVKVHLRTGRTHQIRVQFGSRKFPVAGDGRYGGGKGQIALFSHSFAFRHPLSGEEMRFAALPEMSGVWTHFREELS